jgi:hypothetical protein
LTSRRLRRLPIAELDHVGFVARELTPLMAAFDRLGFRLTEPRSMRSGEPACCYAVFARGYIEFAAAPAGAALPAGSPSFSAARPALAVLALASADVLEHHALAERARFNPTPPALRSRAIDYGREPGEARWREFALDPECTPGALVRVVRNLTPAKIHQREAERHPNGSLALAGITLCADDVDAVATRYAALLGIDPIRPGGSDRICEFALGDQRIRIATPAALRDRYPSAELPAAPCCAGLAVSVRSLAKAVAVLGSNDVEYSRTGGDGVWISTSAAGGVVVELQCADGL